METPPAPETKTKTSNNKQQKQQRASFFIPVFIHLLQWKVVDIKSNEKPERATTGNEKQRRATKSKNGHRSWKNQNEQQIAEGTKSPNGNQTLVKRYSPILCILLYSLKYRFISDNSFSVLQKC